MRCTAVDFGRGRNFYLDKNVFNAKGSDGFALSPAYNRRSSIGLLNCDVPPKVDVSNPWDMISAAQKWLICLQDANINSILNSDGSFDPNMARHNIFKAIMLMNYGYMYESEKKKIQEENRKAEKETHELAFAAK